MNPHVVAIIPARGGSKGVPGKNLRRIGGRSLIERAVDACRAARLVDAVYVSTDDAEIASTAEAAGARVIMRPAELSSDTASSESALLHALDQLIMVGEEPEILVFVQCTSPFIAPDDLDRGVELIIYDNADSVFSAVTTHDFLWRATGRFGLVTGQNHDPAARPRRQDREPDFRETGAFYVMSTGGFRAAQHRFFGRTAIVQVPELSAVDIDHLNDLILAGAVAQVMAPLHEIDVDAVITDFDGVHTDDLVLVAQDGHESVRVSRADGLGVERLRSVGIPLLIVSKEINPVVRARAAKLGVELLHGVEDKRRVVREWLAARQIPGDRAAYLGNDVNDLGPMGLVGWPVAVADAHPAVQQAARLVLARPGGYGAVRELCDLVIEYRQRAQPGVTATASSIGWQESSGESLDERPLARPHETAADHADAELSPLEPRFA
jgi:YrbI family 3-deoxy-D-manno-octulosonate 8-phosphate phosphatase